MQSDKPKKISLKNKSRGESVSKLNQCGLKAQ